MRKAASGPAVGGPVGSGPTLPTGRVKKKKKRQINKKKKKKRKKK
jgi:hypothetical protein